MTIFTLAKSTLTCPHAVLSLIAVVSIFSLLAALTAEVAFGLEPCILCIYQRIPFAIAALLSLLGLLWAPARKPAINLCSYAFLINSGIAFYHTGIEQKWWRSAVEGCAVPPLGDTPQSLLENIMSAPNARCDEIPWADPILGLSMANYNILLCLGMFALCTASFALITQRQAQT